MVTTRELAIARSVIYASLFDYPLTLDQLHHTLIESDQTRQEILAVYDGSETLHDMIAHRDGFFFPVGRGDLIAERRRREARTDAFLTQHQLALRLICALPFTRLVALSGSVAHRNLEPDGDLDLFIVTHGPRVWTVTVALLVLTRLLRRRRTVCANFVLADSHLALDQQDLFTANQVIHLQPLIGGEVIDAFRAANPFVARAYPNSDMRATLAEFSQPCKAGHQACRDSGPEGPPDHTQATIAMAPLVDVRSRGLGLVKRVLEAVLAVPAPLVEGVCRRAYAWHLRRRAGSWRSPDQVQLQSDYLKLHTRSHRASVLDRFDVAVNHALARTERETAPRAVAGGRR